jgi:hypothetical protein
MEEREMNREKDLAGYFQAHRNDEWESEPESAIVKPEPTAVYSLRLRPSELAELRRAAQSRGVSLSELIRESALTHVKESERSGVDIGAEKVQFFGRDARNAGTRGRESSAEDKFPVPLAAATTR